MITEGKETVGRFGIRADRAVLRRGEGVASTVRGQKHAVGVGGAPGQEGVHWQERQRLSEAPSSVSSVK